MFHDNKGKLMLCKNSVSCWQNQDHVAQRNILHSKVKFY